MTDEIQQNRYDQLVRRVGGIIGPGSKVGNVITELMPVLDVERVPGELLILGGMRLAWGGGLSAGAAGQNALFQLFNPAGSNALVVPTTITVSSVTGGILNWGVSNVPLTVGIATQAFRDTRLFSPARPVGEIRTVSQVGLTIATNQVSIPAATPFTLERKNGIATLAPGWGIDFAIDALADVLHFGIDWRERPAEPSELQF